MKLLVGESRKFPIRFNDPDGKGALGTLPPGEYEIKSTYYAKSKGLLEGAREDLVTNSIRIKVTAP